MPPRQSASPAAEQLSLLREVLGVNVDVARSLLLETGSVEDAVALHLAGAGTTSRGGAPVLPAQQVQRFLADMGIPVTDATAQRLLRVAGASVERAVAMYMEHPMLAEREEIVDLEGSEPGPDLAAAQNGNGGGEGATTGAGGAASDAGDPLSQLRALYATWDANHPAGNWGSHLRSPSPDGSVEESSEEETDDSDHSDEHQETVEELYERQGMTVVPHPHVPAVQNREPGFLTDISWAAKQRAAAQAPAPPLPLPLPHLRGPDGRLFSATPTEVPTFAPPMAPLPCPLFLGSVTMPVVAANHARLRAMARQKKYKTQPLEWGTDSPLGHDYVQLHRVVQFDWARGRLGQIMQPISMGSFPVTQVSVDDLVGRQQLQLCLGSTQLGEAAVPGTAEDQQEGNPLVVAGGNLSCHVLCLGALFILERAGIITVRFTLQHKPEQQQEQQEEGVGEEQHSQQGAEGAGPSGPAAAPAASNAGRGQGRGQSRQRKNAPVASPSGSIAANKAAAASSAAAADVVQSTADCTHVCIDISLTEQGLEGMAWDEQSGDLGEEVGTLAYGAGTGKARAARSRGWQKHGDALKMVVQVLLEDGTGLSVGPDCDGLLNFHDTSPTEVVTVPGTRVEREAHFDVANLLDSVAPDLSVAPVAQPPVGLRASPKRYQLSGLQWMLDRERLGDAVGRGHAHLHPAWLQLVTPDRHVLYFHLLRPHVLSRHLYLAPPVGTCGGCVSDEMGLGKSLQTLMLTMVNKPPPGWAVSSVAGLTTAAAGADPVPIKTTLLVAPATLLPQWQAEIEQHLEPGSISWGRFLPPGNVEAQLDLLDSDQAEEGKKGPRRSRRARTVSDGAPAPQSVRTIACALPDGGTAPLHTLDLALISYEHLRDQLHAGGVRTSLLQQYGFWRVCLDEAQLIANSSSVAAVVASSLWRRHAWVISGTPISAGRLDEIRGLLEFLALEPYHQSPYWRTLVGNGFHGCSTQGLLALRALLRGVMLRRSKALVANELDLPPCIREDRVVTLSAVERLVYDDARREFLDACHQMTTGFSGFTTGWSGRRTRAAGRALAALTALRQSTCHPHIVRRRDRAESNERLSFKQIMGRLVSQEYAAWDAAARRLLDARILAAAVAATAGGRDPAAALRPALEEVRANTAAAALTDVWHAVTEVRSMRAGVNQALMPAAGSDAQAPDTTAAEAAEAKAGDEDAGEAAAGPSTSFGLKRRRSTQMQEEEEAAGPSTCAQPLEDEPPAGELSPEEEAARKEARSRGRLWQKLELNGLELLAFLLREAAAPGSRPAKRVKKADNGDEALPPLPPRDELGAVLQAVLAESSLLREELHLGGDLAGEGEVRRSRRQAGIDADSLAEVEVDAQEVADQLENAVVVVRDFKEAMKRRDPAGSAAKAVAAAEKDTDASWHKLQHVVHKQAALAAAEKGKAAAEGVGGSSEVAPEAAALGQEELNSCPICFDDLQSTRRTITACSHHFCPDCIRMALPHGAGPCPICRTHITEADLFEAVSEEEAALQREAAAQVASSSGDYGSKVGALLEELEGLRARDPGAKAVVFSSWGRLLQLVGEALEAHHMPFATLQGGTAAQREAALQRFTTDPDCAVLTVVMSTAGGAAGLTLTVAATAFIMEPALNPGLEAQAAARIYRLGQTKPTRVVRLLAKGSVDALVAEAQRRKEEGAAEGQVDSGMLLNFAKQLT